MTASGTRRVVGARQTRHRRHRGGKTGSGGSRSAMAGGRGGMKWRGSKTKLSSRTMLQGASVASSDGMRMPRRGRPPRRGRSTLHLHRGLRQVWLLILPLHRGPRWTQLLRLCQTFRPLLVLLLCPRLMLPLRHSPPFRQLVCLLRMCHPWQPTSPLQLPQVRCHTLCLRLVSKRTTTK
jgi:hypothetical protein